MKTTNTRITKDTILSDEAIISLYTPPVRPEKVAVVGLGYVGLPLALAARARGHSVIGIDIDERKRMQIFTASVPDLDEDSERQLQENAFEAHGTFKCIEDVDCIIVCVPTPVDSERNPDLTPVRSACEQIGKYLHKGQIVILESTVHPGTCEEIVIPTLERVSGLRAGEDFGLAHCPERINPGDPNWPIKRIPRVIGATDVSTLERAGAFYRSILDALVYDMGSIREAEAVKIVENSFRDINIAFVNELAMSFTKLDIDVVNVLEGAATKPFGFMAHMPGCGVGGHCIPVDPYYLIRYAKRNGFSHHFLSLARSINEHMPAFTVDMVGEELLRRGKSLEGAEVALLGLSYKADVSDMRESPSFEIAHELEERGAHVRLFDPYAPERSSVPTLEDALKGAQVAIIGTAHRAFVSLAPHTFIDHGVEIIVDGRNCLAKETYVAAGLTYRGIGR